VRQKVGFIEADFDVHVVMVRKEAPALIQFRSEGKGVQVPVLVVTKDELQLRSDGRTTDLTYSSEVQFSGRLAALGHGVMKVKARELIVEFQRRVVQRFEEFMARAEWERREGACEPSP
jgi:carbon monoxide dehydrogenase subunit G